MPTVETKTVSIPSGVVVSQSTPSELQVEPVQTDKTKLHATINDPELYPVNTSAPITLSISNVSAQVGPLAAGLYLMCSDVDAYFSQGTNPQVATTSSRKIYGGQPRRLNVSGSNDNYVAVITDGGTDTMTFEKIS